MKFLYKALSRLPFGVLYIVSDIITFIAYRVIRYRKGVVIKNLKNSFPDKSEKEIKNIAKSFYRNLTDVIVETLKGITITSEEMNRRVTFENFNILDEYAAAGQSVYLVTLHQCNWEWHLLGGSINSKVPIDSVYMPLRNKKHNNLMVETRSRFGSVPLEFTKTLKEVVKRTKESTRVIAMVADQSPMPHSKKYWAKFLNQETAFLRGPEQLPKITNLPVVFGGMKRIKRGYYKITLKKIAEPPYEKNEVQILPAFINESEKLIQESPSDWLWSHKRWKFKKELVE